MLIDSHAHLDFVEDPGRVISRAKKEHVGSILTIGTSIGCSKKCVEIAEKEKRIDIFATCGIHPEDGKADIDQFGESYVQELKKVALSNNKVVAIGECGLDFHVGRDQRPVTSDQVKEFQRMLFKAQIKLAGELNLPLVVHCRNAWGEIFRLLSIDYGQSTKLGGVFHSWTGDVEAAKKALDLGFYISFSGIVTFKNAPFVQETAKFVPLNRMLIETDSPFLAPDPNRGSKNEPKNVKIIADFLASLRNVSPSDIYSVTAANARRLFKFE